MSTSGPVDSPKSKPAGFPFYLFVLIAGLLWLGLSNGLRLVGAVNGWEWLTTIGVKPGPFYIAITGGIFAAAFLLAGAGLLVRRAGARNLARAVVVVYAVWLWIDRLVVAQSRADSGWQFALGATLVLVVFTFTALSAARALFPD